MRLESRASGLDGYGCAFRHRLEHRFEQEHPSGASDGQLERPLRVRHQSDDVPRLVTDSGDVVQGSVWIGIGGRQPILRRVPEHDLSIPFEAIDYLGLGIEVTLAMSDRN